MGSDFVFFKQKTAYEMRISDWSSDVCSSDLVWHRLAGDQMRFHRLAIPSRQGCAGRVAIQHALVPFDQRVAVLDGADVAQDRLGRRAVRTFHAEMPLEVADPRSEESRVGKRVVSRCRSRRWPVH